MTSYRIVVGMDLEDSGDVALIEALRLAGRVPGSELHPVHAMVHDPSAGPCSAIDLSQRLGRAMERLRDRVEQVIDGLKVAQRVRLHVRSGHPVEVLQQVAIDHGADAVVVGTRASPGLEHAILGAVASDLVRVARLPVLVARLRRDAGPLPEVPARGPGEISSEVYQLGPRFTRIAGLT